AAAQEGLDDVSKQGRVLGAEEPVADLLDGPAEFGMLFVVLPGIVVRPECVYLGGSQAEDKDVVVAHLFANLDVRAVHRADGESATESELHVTCAGGFGPGG